MKLAKVPNAGHLRQESLRFGDCWVAGVLDWILEGEDDDQFASPKLGQDPFRTNRR